VDNTVLVVAAAIAVIVAVVATSAALRAGRRATRAADRVALLLDAEEAVEPVEPEAPPAHAVNEAARATPDAPDELDLRVHDVDDVRDRPGRVDVVSDPSDRGDGRQARIPVLDLDRLRAWLTDGNVRLGRVAVVSVELDNLDHVDDRLGYRAGVHLIEAITERLRTVTRPRDVVAHVNRERFVLVCRDVPDRGAAEGLAERIAMGVAHPSVVVAGVAEVTASIGVALAADLHERPESVLRRAIEAGNRARALGGARIEISEDASPTPFTDVDFAAALTDEQFVLHYLPIVSCATGRIAGFETLVRWDHPQHGLLLPGEFLAQAERTGAIVPMGMWVIEAGCRQLVAWHRHGAAATLKLDVNLSAREFSEPSLPAQVRRVITESELPAGAVWLEITEETLLQDRDASDRTLAQLHEIGVRLVIDDFGAGASSLVSLRQFPLDAIKIDRAFVADLGTSRDRDAICRAIVDLAHSLGLCAIAEGVETMEQFAALRSFGCELAQGRLFGAARPAPDWGATPAPTTGVQQFRDA
jgi:diguanylate cyclase (GGDEF)-like protein